MMNHVFRVIWSSFRKAFIAVSELDKTSGKRASGVAGQVRKKSQNHPLHMKALAAAIAACFTANAYPNPFGAQIVNGSVTLSQSGNTLTVVNSPNAIINWQGFSINRNETTRFIQQSASSAVLNRVLGSDPSQLLGMLSSNGKVFLINPSGILVGQGARIDVAGLVAATLNLSDADFLSGKLSFGATLNAGALQNLGSISTPSGGTVYLVAPQVENRGVIITPQGETLLAAGNTVRLIDTGAPGVSVQLTGSANVATNLGQILADSGRIGMVGAVVRNSGALNADSLVSQGGRIYLKADQSVDLAAGSVTSANGAGNGGTISIDSGAVGTTSVSGMVSATGVAGNGGMVEILGNTIGLYGGANVDVSGDIGGGSAFIGGNFHGAGPQHNATQVIVGQDAALNADALGAGNGGNIAVWSDFYTQFYGHISARGGALSGNGGFVETSGKQSLSYHGAVDTSAANGMLGTLLLDPANIDIVATGAASLLVNSLASTVAPAGGILFATADAGAAGIAPSTLLAGTVLDVAALNGATANVVLQANNNITFSTSVAMTTAGVGLTAQAGNNISWGANTIVTNGGAVSFSANDLMGGGSATTLGSISGTGAIATGGGAITLAASGLGSINVGALNSGAAAALAAFAGANGGAVNVSTVDGLIATGAIDASGSAAGAGAAMALAGGNAGAVTVQITGATAARLVTVGAITATGGAGGATLTGAAAGAGGAGGAVSIAVAAAIGAAAGAGGAVATQSIATSGGAGANGAANLATDAGGVGGAAGAITVSASGITPVPGTPLITGGAGLLTGGALTSTGGAGGLAGGALAATGATGADAAIMLSSGDPVNVSAAINAGVAAVNLTSATHILETGSGAITAGSLIANATGGTTLSGVNLLGGLDVQMGGIAGTGALTVTGGATTITGALTTAILGLSGGALNLDSMATTTLAAVNLTGGSLNNTGLLNIGSLNVNLPDGGFATLGGAGAVNLTGAGSFAKTSGGMSGAMLIIDGGKVLTNAATGSYTQTGFGANDEAVLSLANGSSLANAGSWTMTNSAINFGSSLGNINLNTLLMNGSAAMSGNSLLLTSAAGGTASAYLMTPFSTSNNFESAFSFNISGGSGADGISFIMQNAGLTALGGGGGGIGVPGITPSIAAAYRTWAYNQIDIWQNGGAIASTGGGSVNLRNQTLYSWVNYSAASNTMQVFLSASNIKPATATLTGSVNLATQLGSQMYLGFTGATGAATDNQIINSWSLTQPGTGTVTNSGTLQILNGASSIGGSIINNNLFNVAGTANISGTFTNSPTGTVNLAGILSAGNGVANSGAINVTGASSLNTAGNMVAGNINAGINTLNLHAAGNMSLTGWVSAGNISLTSGGAISETGAGAISTTGSLTTSAIAGTALNGANTVANFSATDTADIGLSNTAATLLLGPITAGGTLVVYNTGNLTVAGSIAILGSGPAPGLGVSTSGLLQSSGFMFTNNGSITLANGSSGLMLTADRMALAGGSISVPSGTVSLNPWTASAFVDLGSTVKTTLNTLELAQADLAAISSANLNIAANNNITVTAPISVGAATLTLNANAANVVGASGAISEGALATITANALVTYSAGGTTLNGANAISGFSATNSGGGIISLNSSLPLTISGIATGGAVTLSAPALAVNGAIASSGGDIVLLSSDGITQSADITSFGNVTLTANANGGPGNFVQRSGLISNTDTAAPGNITINAYDIQVGATSSKRNVLLNAAHDIRILNAGLIGGGTAKNFHADDSYFAYALPFGFTYYGVPYSNMYISSNGLITFGNATSSYWNSAAGLQSMGMATISPAWNDWVTYATATNDIYIHQPSANTLAVRWDVNHWSNSSQTANFEAVLSQQGNISFNYGAGTSGYASTIGVSKGDGVHYTMSALNGSANLNNLSSASFNYNAATGNYAETLLGGGGNGGAASNLTAVLNVSLLATGLSNIRNPINAASIHVQSNSISLAGILTASGTGDAIVLNAGAGNFINNAGANALTAPAGRWLVYSADPAPNIFGGLASGNFALWGRTFANYAPGSVMEAGNRYLFGTVPVLTASVDNMQKTYGDANVATTLSVVGLVDAARYGNVFTQETFTGSVTTASAGFAANAPVNGGAPYIISVTPGNIVAPAGYGATLYADAQLIVNPFAVNMTGNRAYDGSANVAAGIFTLGALFGNETLTLSGTGSMDSPDVGTRAVNTSGLTLGNGTGLASNYTFSGGAQTVTINPSLVSTWIGATGSDWNWNTAANWAGNFIPQTGAAVTIPALAGQTITQTTGATLRTLDTATSLTLSGGVFNLGNTIADASFVRPGAMLNLAGATLTLNGSLSADALRLAGGVLNGAGALSVFGNYSQTAGQLAGTLQSLTLHSLGNFNLIQGLAATQSIALSSTGAITGAAGMTHLSAPSVTLIAAAGIGSAAAPLQLVTASLDANTAAGGGYLINTPNAPVTRINFITNDASALSYSQNGQALTLTGIMKSMGGALLIDPPTNFTMSALSGMNSGGGAVTLLASGDILLSSINAGAGAASITTTGGMIGSSLAAGLANVTAGSIAASAVTGAQFSFNVPAGSPANVTSTGGVVLASNLATGVVINNAPAPTATVVQAAVQVIQQQTIIAGAANPSPPPPPPPPLPPPMSSLSSVSMPATFGPPGGTIGGTAGSFGGTVVSIIEPVPAPTLAAPVAAAANGAAADTVSATPGANTAAADASGSSNGGATDTSGNGHGGSASTDEPRTEKPGNANGGATDASGNGATPEPAPAAKPGAC